MKSFFFSSSLFFPLSLFLLSFLIFFIHGVTSQTLINQTCHLLAKGDPNINFNHCTTSILAAPASQCATLRGLGIISIRLIRYNVTDTRCHIKQLLKKKLDHFTRVYLDDCFELYSDAIYSVEDAMEAYNAKRYYDANIIVSSIMDAASTCEDGFQERKGLVSPITKRNNDTFELSAVSLGIMSLLRNQTAGSD